MRGAVFRAARGGDLQVLKTWVHTGGTLSATDEDGNTVLHVVCSQGHVECAVFLLEARADPNVLNKDMLSSLHYAAFFGHDKCVKVLCMAGADVSMKNKARPSYSLIRFTHMKQNGKTPIEDAIDEKHSTAVCTLLVEGTASNDIDGVNRIDLSNFGLESLPLLLLRVPNLRRLDGLREEDGNPLSMVPVNVKNGSIREVMQYLQDTQKSGRILWPKVKVMVLGKEGVGKTHILKLLCGLRYERNESTNGIDINNFILDGRELTWFDFGGQEVFYPTHQFFLTHQCVYLIVFRLNDLDFLERVQHWLKTVAQFTTDPRRAAKVIVVGTHLDALASPEGANARWAKLIPVFEAHGNVTAVLNVSCVNKTGVLELKDAILKAIETSSFGSQLVPKTYIDVGAAVVSQKTSGKIKMDVATFCAQLPKLSQIQIENALKFLADAGICFFDEQIGVVITDLQWLADMFKQVVSFYSGVKDGVVTLSGLKHDAWKNLPNEEVKQYMALLEKFHMAFPRLEDNSWVVPSMLKEQPLLTKHEAAGSLTNRRHERTYDLELMPSGAIGRLIVRLQSHKSLSLTEMWRDGMHVKCIDGTQVGSIVLELDNPVRIRIQCFVLRNSTRSLIQVLSDECTAVLNEMYVRCEEKPFKEFISCPHCLAKTGGAVVVRLPKVQCAQWMVENAPVFTCGLDQVPVSELRADVTLGELKVFDERAVVLEKEPFAAGSFGLVFRALMGKTGVVVKELNPTKAKQWAVKRKAVGVLDSEIGDVVSVSAFNHAAFEEFQHEASLMSRLLHQNIVRLHGTMLNPLRLVMEDCAHGDLHSALEKHLIWNGPVPVRNARASIPPLCNKIILDIAHGMAFLHSQHPPIAHRDLRSPNVFLASLNPSVVCAKVADFGLSVGITSRQTMCLQSWQWMAPEAQMGANYTHLCDVYSFGIVANEVFTQCLPFLEYETKMRQAEMFRKLLNEGLRPTIPPFVPVWMRELIGETWCQNPNSRPSMEACVYRLEHNGHQKEITSFHVAAPETPKNRIVFETLDGALLCMSHHADQVWIGCGNEEVRVLAVKDLKRIRKEKHEGKVVAICSPSPSVAFSGAIDGTLRFWSPDDSKPPVKSKPILSSLGRSSGQLPRFDMALGNHPSLPPAGQPVLKLGEIRQAWKLRHFILQNGALFWFKNEASLATGGVPVGALELSTVSEVKELVGEIKKKGCVLELCVSGKDSRFLSFPTTQSRSQLVAAMRQVVGKHAVTALVTVSNVIFQGCASGELKALSLTNQPLSSTILPGSISCACTISEKCVWLGVGHSIHQATYRNKLLTTQVRVKDAHADALLAIVYTSRSQVWSATAQGEVCVWDASTADKCQSFSLSVRLNSMCAVKMQGVDTVWMGCDDEVRVFNSANFSLRCVLPLPHPGEITCMAHVGIDVVWVGVRNRGDKGSLYIWDFSQ